LGRWVGLLHTNTIHSDLLTDAFARTRLRRMLHARFEYSMQLANICKEEAQERLLQIYGTYYLLSTATPTPTVVSPTTLLALQRPNPPAW
jgi:hypothetical protein